MIDIIAKEVIISQITDTDYRRVNEAAIQYTILYKTPKVELNSILQKL